MPSLNCINQLAYVKFFGNMKKLPHDFQHPSGDPAAKQYDDAFKPEDKICLPPQTVPPMFMFAEPNRYYQETCDKIGKDFQDFIDAAIDGVKFALDMWRCSTGFQNLNGVGPAIIGAPGCLKTMGPPLDTVCQNAPQWQTWSPKKRENFQKYSDAVSKGIAKSFKDFQDQVMIPGLPLCPAFTFFPGPMCPPMPIQVTPPLLICPSAMVAKILTPELLKQSMIGELDGGVKDKDKGKFYEALFDALGTAFSMAFTIWLPSQMVQLVMLGGPVPSFAPPYVPGGPVMTQICPPNVCCIS